ncbi:MAG: Crp/Fnr family transcriptional regulator [Eubacterium sp.]|nr:Crp/Fnr family transcriptional regulator [Eubacterium sp.]
MKKYYGILSQCPLFEGIEQGELDEIIRRLNGKKVNVSKGNPVFLEGDSARYIGVVLLGTVHVVREDYYGNRSVMAVLQPGEMFAEAFSCAGIETMPVSVIALTDCEVLLLDCRHIFASGSTSCHYHSLLMRNLLQGMAQKNLALAEKIRYMSQKTTKEKLMAYLLEQAKQQGSKEFVIPHNRQSLADYLGVERSAMSAEISKLKKSGVIDTRGSWFCLK